MAYCGWCRLYSTYTAQPVYSCCSDGESQDSSQTFDSMVRDQNKKHKKSGGFQSMGLNPNVYKGIVKKGYKQPTPIQVAFEYSL